MKTKIKFKEARRILAVIKHFKAHTSITEVMKYSRLKSMLEEVHSEFLERQKELLASLGIDENTDLTDKEDVSRLLQIQLQKLINDYSDIDTDSLKVYDSEEYWSNIQGLPITTDDAELLYRFIIRNEDNCNH